jgi:AcrR family transcriptional regulator
MSTRQLWYDGSMRLPNAGKKERPRQARAQRNDQRIRDAAETLLAQEGWGAFSRRAIARVAGTSEQVVRSRIDDAEHFAMSLWRERYAPHAIARLAGLLAAHGLLEASATPELPNVWHEFLSPTPSWQATMELLVASHFHAGLQASVHADLGAAITNWTTPTEGGVSLTLATQRAFVIMRALGFLMLAPHTMIDAATFDPFALDFKQRLDEVGAATPLPEVHAEHLDHLLPFDSGDEQLNRTLRATFEIVSEIGFEHATLTTIAHRAGIDNNYIYRRYPSKTHLFMDATLRQRHISGQKNAAFKAAQATDYGPGIAEALLMRELMHPERSALRRAEIEQWRLSWHHPDLRTALRTEANEPIKQLNRSHPLIPLAVIQAGVHTGRAAGIGVNLLASLNPSSWNLPFHIVTNTFYPPAEGSS